MASTEYAASAEESGMENQEAKGKTYSTGAEDASLGLIQETGSRWVFIAAFPAWSPLHITAYVCQ